MIRKLASFIVIIFLSSLLAGCWDRRELPELAIVLGCGVDLIEKDRLLLTVQIAKPASFFAGDQGSGGGGSGQQAAPVWAVSAEGKTVSEAITNLQRKLPRHLYWGHNMVLILGEKLARKGAFLATNFFPRAMEPRGTIKLLVTSKEAKTILETPVQLNQSSGQYIDMLVRHKALGVNLIDWSEMAFSRTMQPVVPGVEVEDVPKGPDSMQATPQTGKNIVISRTAVFKEDKMLGWLDDSETQGLLWLKGEMDREVVTIASPSRPGKVSINITGETLKIRPHYDGRNLRFDVKIATTANVEEQQSREHIFTGVKEKDMERETAGQIKRQIAGVLEKAQHEYGVDIFGFGKFFHRKYKKEFHNMDDNWDAEFARAQVNIEVEVDIRLFGLSSMPNPESLETLTELRGSK